MTATNPDPMTAATAPSTVNFADEPPTSTDTGRWQHSMGADWQSETSNFADDSSLEVSLVTAEGARNLLEDKDRENAELKSENADLVRVVAKLTREHVRLQDELDDALARVAASRQSAAAAAASASAPAPASINDADVEAVVEGSERRKSQHLTRTANFNLTKGTAARSSSLPSYRGVVLEEFETKRARRGSMLVGFSDAKLNCADDDEKEHTNRDRRGCMLIAFSDLTLKGADDDEKESAAADDEKESAAAEEYEEVEQDQDYYDVDLLQDEDEEQQQDDDDGDQLRDEQREQFEDAHNQNGLYADADADADATSSHARRSSDDSIHLSDEDFPTHNNNQAEHQRDGDVSHLQGSSRWFSWPGHTTRRAERVAKRQQKRGGGGGGIGGSIISNSACLLTLL